MSMLPISHFTWQVLRTAKRSTTPLAGKQLRITPSRSTKDGTFLDALVAAGLLEVVGVDQPDDKTKRLPTQFRTRYKLTEKGEYAAEHGQYEREPVRQQTIGAAQPPEPRQGKRSAPRRQRSGTGPR